MQEENGRSRPRFFNAPVNAMTEESPDKSDRSYNNSLYPEDQKKVDEFVNRGINSVQRKPFRPLRLMLMLIVVVTTLSILSQFLARWAGIY
jgi:hypothetical protein